MTEPEERLCPFHRCQAREMDGEALAGPDASFDAAFSIFGVMLLADWRRGLRERARWMMDKHGNKEARAEIAMIKVATPNIAWRVIDWGILAFGGAGVTGDYGLAYAYATARALRLADGPDEVHRNQIARLELRKYQGPASLTGGSAEVLAPDPAAGFRQRPVLIA